MADPDADFALRGSRPKRSTRPPSKYLDDNEDEVIPRTRGAPRAAKRKLNYNEDNDEARDENGAELDFLLQSPKSVLTRINISDIINTDTWQMLSPASRSMLASLLPPTAFLDYQAEVSLYHPSHASSSTLQSTSSHHPDLLSPGLFADSHFLSAAHTFQDHLFSSFLSPSTRAATETWREDVQSGNTHFPWKDEKWAREHQDGIDADEGERNTRNENAIERKLPDIVRNGVLRVGDVLAYKRACALLGITVEKDVMIASIHPKTHALEVLIPRGVQTHLTEGNQDPSLLHATITSPTQLETVIFDTDGRVERSRRPNGNAWKSITVWRQWDGEGIGEGMQGARVGMESQGTLFYLRQSFYQDV